MALTYGNGGGLVVTMEGPFGSGGTAAKLTEISLLADDWKGAESPYSQVVVVDGVSVNSMVNLHLSAEQLELFHDKDIAFVAENDGGVVTVYAIGDRPTLDHTIQVTLMEVIA